VTFDPATVISVTNGRECDACRKPLAALRVEANLVTSIDKPQSRTLAITISATRTPPTIDQEIDGRIVAMPNPDHDAADLVIVATWERGADLCNDQDCFHNLMDKMWKEAQRKLAKLWRSP
jgi:hypothetical protein